MCSILKPIKAAGTPTVKVLVFHFILIKYFTGGKFGVWQQWSVSTAMKCVYRHSISGHPWRWIQWSQCLGILAAGYPKMKCHVWKLIFYYLISNCLPSKSEWQKNNSYFRMRHYMHYRKYISFGTSVLFLMKDLWNMNFKIFLITPWIRVIMIL